MTFFNQISGEKNFIRNFLRNICVISVTPRAFFTNIWPRSVRLRANCTANEEVLRQRDVALKFRGCFQAVCEPRGVPTGRRGLVSPESGMVCGRQGVVVLEPTYRATKWPSASLSVFLPLSLSLSLSSSLLIPSTFQIHRSFSPSLSSLSHPHFPPPHSIHFPPFVCLAYRPWKRTVTLRCPFDRFIETTTHSANLHELFFIAFDSPPRVDKRTNRDQNLTFCQVNDYSCANNIKLVYKRINTDESIICRACYKRASILH